MRMFITAAHKGNGQHGAEVPSILLPLCVPPALLLILRTAHLHGCEKLLGMH